VGWTAFIIVLMVIPGQGTITQDLSRAGGGTDTTDAVGHVLLFGSLVVMWWQAHYPEQGALLAAALVGLMVGFTTELLQLWVPGRGAALIDFAANGLGVLLAGVVIRLLLRWRGLAT
jgi:VanZ family protein